MGVDKTVFPAFWFWFFERNVAALLNAARRFLICSRSSGESSPGGAFDGGIGVVNNPGSRESTEPTEPTEPTESTENTPEFNQHGHNLKNKRKRRLKLKTCMC